MDQARAQMENIVDVCKRIHSRGWISSTDGNVSVRLDDGRIITTPSGIHKGFMTVDQLVVVNMDGEKISGSAELKPSSELAMHLACYRERPEIRAVVHAHPTFCVAFSLARVSLAKCLLPEVVFTLGSIPFAEYAPPTTEAVPKSIEELIKTHDAVILSRHGSVTVGKDVFDAYNTLERMEHVAEITYHARQLGGGKIEPLSDAEVCELVGIRDRMGLKARDVGVDCNSCNTCGKNPARQPPVSAEKQDCSCNTHAPAAVSQPASPVGTAARTTLAPSRETPASAVIPAVSPRVMEIIMEEVARGMGKGNMG